MTEYQNYIKELLKVLNKDKFILNLKKKFEFMSVSDGVQTLFFLDERKSPDEIKLHLFKNEKRWFLAISGTNGTKIVHKLMFKRSFEKNDFESMFKWYEGCLNKLLDDYDELQKFRNKFKDVKITQKGISRFLFKINGLELWFGRFILYKQVRLPWNYFVYTLKTGCYEGEGFKPSFGLMNTFFKGIEKLRNATFTTLPPSLRDLSILKEAK